MKQDAAWYEQQYNPRTTVTNFQQIFDRWDARSSASVSELEGYYDVPYGVHAAQKMDIYRARGASKACLLFIHGGYWRALDKRAFTFLAPAFTKAGVTFANVNYALAPSVTVEEIVRQILQASAWLYRNASNFGASPNRLYVCGHSAGGHLTAMMMCALWPVLSPDLPRKIFQGGLSISGLHDMRPIRLAQFLQTDLKLDEASAQRLSPALMPSATDAPIYTCVGGDESEQFHWQNGLIAAKWGKVFNGDIAMPGENHFTVIERLGDPDSALFKGAMKMMGLPA